MKKFVKFIPAALAVVALASCSSDDLFEKNGNADLSGKTINVYVEGDDQTRTAIQEDEQTGNQFVWTAGDEFKLYGTVERLTNTYRFTQTTAAAAEYSKTSAQAYLVGDDNLGTSLAYALYPNYDNSTDPALKNKNFFNSEYFAQFEMVLPKTWAYDTEKAQDGVYYAEFPMWGEANANHDAVTFKYTTAFMRIELTGLSAASTAELIITADQQLCGRFIGNVKEGGDPNGAAVAYPALEPADAEVAAGTYTMQTAAQLNTAFTSDVLYSTLTPAELKLQQVKITLDQFNNNDKRVIYLPIPCQNYGHLSMVLNYPNEHRQDVVREGKPLPLIGKRGAFGKITKSFSVTDEFKTPKDINQELYNNRTDANPLNYISHVQMTVDGATISATDPGLNTILMPNMASQNIVLNFDYPTAPAITQNAAGDILYIKDLDAANPFTGKLVINTLSIGMDIDINLPQADVQLIGADDATYYYKNVFVHKAKSITFGDGTTVTKQGSGDIITDYANTGATVLVEKNATAYSVRMKNKDAEVEVKGTAERVGFDRNNPTLTVTGGTINFLRSYFVASSTDKATGTVTSTGAANIKKVDAGETNFEFSSTWDGESAIAPQVNLSSAYTVYTAAQLAYFQSTTWTPADVTINLLTDVDLDGKNWAGINNTAKSVTIDATDTHFGTNLAGTSEFHSIINLDLTKGVNVIADANTAALTKTGLGLISVAKDVTISTGLNISTVNCVLHKYYDKGDQATSGTYDFAIHGIGSLVGNATGDVSLTNVKVMLAGNKFGYGVSGSKGTYIGGIVGKADGAITITKSEVNMTPGSNTMICGYYNLGGIVGGESANDKDIVIGNSTAGNVCTVTIGGFTVDYNNGKTIDKNMGRVGGFIGSAGSMTANNVYWNGDLTAAVTLYGTATVNTWPTQAMMKNKIIQGSAPDFDYLTYTKNNDFIGYCGDEITSPGTINVNNNVAKTTPLTKPDGSDNQGKALYWFE